MHRNVYQHFSMRFGTGKALLWFGWRKAGRYYESGMLIMRAGRNVSAYKKAVNDTEVFIVGECGCIA